MKTIYIRYAEFRDMSNLRDSLINVLANIKGVHPDKLSNHDFVYAWHLSKRAMEAAETRFYERTHTPDVLVWGTTHVPGVSQIMVREPGENPKAEQVIIAALDSIAA